MKKSISSKPIAIERASPRRVEVAKLIGVIDAALVNHKGFDGDLEEVMTGFSPSPHLLRQLAMLPEGTIVGIGRATPDTIIRNKALFYRSDFVKRDSDKYWETIVEICKASGLKVVYLEDVEIPSRIASILRLREDYKNETVTSNKMYDLINYLRRVERQRRMVQNIVEKKPNVVITDLSLADTMWLKAEGMTQGGITDSVVFGSYAADTPIDTAAFLSSNHKRKIAVDLTINWAHYEGKGERLLANLKINEFTEVRSVIRTDNKNVAYFDRALRRRFAQTVGRITDWAEYKPTFVGTTGSSPVNMFQIHVNPNNISGIIVDTRGEAFFTSPHKWNPKTPQFRITLNYNFNAIFFGAPAEPVSCFGFRDEAEGVMSGLIYPVSSGNGTQLVTAFNMAEADNQHLTSMLRRAVPKVIAERGPY